MRRRCLPVALRLLRHEPSRRDGLRLAAAALLLGARSRLGLDRGGRVVNVQITAPNGVRTSLKLWTYVDVLVAHEVFVDRDYRPPAGLAPQRILDLGANTGISVRFLRALFPAAAIVAVEPDPANFARLRRNAADATLVPAAVAAERGTGTLYVGAEGWGSSLAERAGARPVEVPLLTVEDALRAGGDAGRAGLVKVDIEGGEWPLLEAGALQRATDCIVGELHFDDGRSVESARRLFAGWRLDVHEKRPAVATFTARRDRRRA
jgi:FkbM family methyltransferase